jgi:beta-galactosidase
VPFATGTLEARATKNGTIAATDTVQTAGAPAAIAFHVDRSMITADGQDLAYVEADIVDAQGVVVPQADNEISFTVSGAGALVGVDNGNPITHDSYKGTKMAAFSGKALAILQSTSSAGSITLTAASDGGTQPLASASVTVTTQGR